MIGRQCAVLDGRVAHCGSLCRLRPWVECRNRDVGEMAYVPGDDRQASTYCDGSNQCVWRSMFNPAAFLLA